MNFMRANEVFDISILLGLEDATYPGDAAFSRDEVASIASGADYNLSTLTLSAHSGTHLDSPAHFIKNGRTIDQYEAANFIIPAHVIYVEDDESIKPDPIMDFEMNRGDALLFKTANSISGLSRKGMFSKEYIYMSEEAAVRCIELEAGLVGIDYVSVDRFDDDEAPVHKRLLRREILLLECIDLVDVPPGDYTLFCVPIKIKGSEASPVRAMLFR
jgi:arylformamidase